jgi:hypothetical protein
MPKMTVNLKEHPKITQMFADTKEALKPEADQMDFLKKKLDQCLETMHGKTRGNWENVYAYLKENGLHEDPSVDCHFFYDEDRQELVEKTEKEVMAEQLADMLGK